jgi:hypothetical protein
MSDLSDNALLWRAVKNARSHQVRRRHQRWVAVMELFEITASEAKGLCKQFDCDPEETVLA